MPEYDEISDDVTGADEVVVTVGGDGTLLAASHNVESTPILGVSGPSGSRCRAGSWPGPDLL